VLMSLAAPVIAACIHSLWVFHSGTGCYNAEIGGTYFHGAYKPVDEPSLLGILAAIGACGVPAVPTFLVLLAFQKQRLYCRIIWVLFIVLWLLIFFNRENAIK